MSSIGVDQIVGTHVDKAQEGRDAVQPSIGKIRLIVRVLFLSIHHAGLTASLSARIWNCYYPCHHISHVVVLLLSKNRRGITQGRIYSAMSLFIMPDCECVVNDVLELNTFLSVLTWAFAEPRFNGEVRREIQTGSSTHW